MTNPIEELKERFRVGGNLFKHRKLAQEAIRLAECYREIAGKVSLAEFETTDEHSERHIIEDIDQEASELFQGRAKE